MFRKMLLLGNVAALTVVGALLGGTPVLAQQGEHLYETTGSWGRSSPEGVSSLGYTAPGYYGGFGAGTAVMPPSVGFGAPIDQGAAYQSFYPSDSFQNAMPMAPNANMAANANMNRPAVVNLAVPPNAEVWFGDTQTKQTGAFRQYYSPPLTPGREFVYEVKTKWTENGKDVTRSRTIPVHAGDVINVSIKE